MSVPVALDGFDVTAAVERMLDQPPLWWAAVGLFVGHFADWEQGWLASVGNDTLEQKCVHALRSAAANVGAAALSASAAALEAQLLRRMAGEAAEVPAEMRQHLQESFRKVWQTASVAVKTSSAQPEGMPQ
jgi:hypothetical protein